MPHDDPNNPICGLPEAPSRFRPSHRLPCRFPHIPARCVVAVLLGAAAALGPAVRAEWVEFADETAARLVAATAVGAADPDEKSYSWGDVDRDGDQDLVVARKQPFSTPGKRRNVLFLNEGGVLVDRTVEYAASSDVVGDLGFLTPTNDRDILLVDVDLDGWLDVVTATVQGAADPKHVGHPRIYRNLRDGPEGWLGFRHEDARIPLLLTAGGAPGNPSFASVVAGDVDADGDPDLYFSDYDAGEPAGSDVDDRLLVNLGPETPGFFADGTDAFVGTIEVPGQPDRPFPVSAFSASAAIADMNGDGARDVLKQTAISIPTYVGIAYNDPAAPGVFDTYDVIYMLSPYYVSVGDLNNDQRLDVVVTDDGSDRYLLNQGNGADGLANFLPFTFSYAHDGAGQAGGDQGFGGNSLVADLDNDGWQDVLVTDVSVDIPGCGRRLRVFRNLGGEPGDAVVLQEQTSGEGCQVWMGNPPSCIVAGVPASQLEGVHDAAVFDIDGDGWKDLVLGRCAGMAIYRNVPPLAAGAVPDRETIGSVPLLVGKAPGGRVTLSWGPSCVSTDDDSAIYEGTIGDFTSHVWRTCSTDGATTFTLTAGDAAYLLVVPRNARREGSYGWDSHENQRPPSADACLPQLLGACE